MGHPVLPRAAVFFIDAVGVESPNVKYFTMSSINSPIHKMMHEDAEKKICTSLAELGHRGGILKDAQAQREQKSQTLSHGRRHFSTQEEDGSKAKALGK